MSWREAPKSEHQWRIIFDGIRDVHGRKSHLPNPLARYRKKRREFQSMCGAWRHMVTGGWHRLSAHKQRRGVRV